MESLRENFWQLWQVLRDRYDSLSQREQVIVLGGGATLLVLLLYSGLNSILSSASGIDARIARKTRQLDQAYALAQEYSQKAVEFQRQKRDLSNNTISLVQRIEEAKDVAGIEIPSLKPRNGSPNDAGLVESSVELSLKEISIDRLESFLNAIKEKPGKVVVRRLEVKRERKKDTLRANISISSYQLGESK